MKVEKTIKQVSGFNAAGIHANLKKSGARDLALIVSDRPCVASGVFTTNRVKAAPVLYNQARLTSNANSIRAVAVNTVSANACTGQQGMQNAERMAMVTAESLSCSPEQILVMSTGVIGTQLPMDKITTGIERAAAGLGSHWTDAASAIMTTDTRPKQASVKVYTVDGDYTIAGIAKGAGMIAPNMATMLGIIVTDVAIGPDLAQSALVKAVNRTFNRIVVDGDTSTNDMVVLLANGASGVRLNSQSDIDDFIQALTDLSGELARDIVRDGEGVSKFITLSVTGATDDEMALAIGRTIAASPLVKTAFYGNDANWGRIVAAAGRAGVEFDPSRARLWFAPGEELPEEGKGLLLFEGGMPTSYRESDASEIIRQPSVYVTLDCGQGRGSCRIWTCDISHDYVSINAEYRS